MFGENKVSDKELVKAVSKRLQRSGGSGLTADIQHGIVTLRGRIRYATERKVIVKIIASIAGVRRVIDQIQLQPRRTG